MLKEKAVRAIIVVLMIAMASHSAQAAPGGIEPQQLVAEEGAAETALLSEAAVAIRQAGFGLKEFDLENAVTSPDHRALFVPVTADEAIETHAEQFLQGERRLFLTGILYTRKSFELAGQRYTPGVHPVVLENADVAPLESLAEGPVFFQETEFGLDCTGGVGVRGPDLTCGPSVKLIVSVGGGASVGVGCTAGFGLTGPNSTCGITGRWDPKPFFTSALDGISNFFKDVGQCLSPLSKSCSLLPGANVCVGEPIPAQCHD